MYERYWKLTRKPFGEWTNPELFFPARSHKMALNRLSFIVREQKGMAMLLGACGVGKTITLNRLVSDLMEEHTLKVARIVNPHLRGADLLLALARSFGIQTDSHDPALLHEQLEKTFVEWGGRGVRPLLIIEEAHLIVGRQEFNMLQSLLALEADGLPVLTMLLCGSPYLDRRARTVRGIGERIALSAMVEPLGSDELRPYLDFLMGTAGGTSELFDDSAVATIFDQTHGIPRRVNRVAELALLAGAAYEADVIDHKLVTNVSQDLISRAA